MSTCVMDSQFWYDEGGKGVLNMCKNCVSSSLHWTILVLFYVLFVLWSMFPSVRHKHKALTHRNILHCTKTTKLERNIPMETTFHTL